MTDRLLPCVEINPHGKVDACVIWLHGLGADGHDFEPLASQLDLAEAPAFRFVFPHAPKRPVTINGGYVMRAWFDISETDLSGNVDRAGIRESQTLVQALVEREIANGIPAARIVLGGFSQGGAIALEAGVRHPSALAGIAALSAYIPLPAEFPNANHPVPCFLAHGDFDPVIPLFLAERCRKLLQAKGYPAEWHSYPMQHAVSREEILDLRAWLLRRLPSRPNAQ